MLTFSRWGPPAFNTSSLIADSLARPQDAIVHKQKIYWSEAGTNYPGAVYPVRFADGLIKRSDMDGSNVETIKTGLYYVIGIDIGRNPYNAAAGPINQDLLFYADQLGGPDCESGDDDGYKGQVGYVALDGSESGALIEGCNDKNAYMDDPISVAYVGNHTSLPTIATPGIMYAERGTDTGGEEIQGIYYRCLSASFLTPPHSLWLDEGTHPTTVAYDDTTNRVYWSTQGSYPYTGTGKIWRGTLNLVEHEILGPEVLVDGIDYITALTLDTVKQEMYWSEGPFSLTPGSPPWYYTCDLEDKKIWYTAMDGTGTPKEFMGLLNMPMGSFISPTRRLYLIDGCDGTAKSIPLSGSGYYNTSSFEPIRIPYFAEQMDERFGMFPYGTWPSGTWDISYPEYGTPKNDTTFDSDDGWDMPLPTEPIWNYVSDKQYDATFDSDDGWDMPSPDQPIWSYPGDEQHDELFELIVSGGTWPSGSWSL